MTPAEQVRLALADEDAATVRRVVAVLAEAERADLVPIARESAAGLVARGLDAAGHLGPMLLLAYGTLGVTEIRKLGWRSRHLPTGLADVLRGRDPERLGPIIDYLLEDVGGPRVWAEVRPLVREGIVPRPDGPAYPIAMLAATRYRPAAELVAADPAVLDVDAWLLFEVEGGGEDSLANHEKFFGDSWGDVFRELAARDPAARARLLDVSLAALGRDFATYRAGWFSRFHESLAPTDDERALRADAYLALLRSRVGPTVSFAVAALNRIERAGRLVAADLLDRVEPVLGDGPAGTSKAALDVVARVAARSPADARRAALATTAALRHSSPDVQRAAIRQIGMLAPGPDPEIAAAVESSGADIAASQRAAAAALVERLGGRVGDPGSPPPATGGEPATEPRATGSPLDPSRRLEPLETLDALVDVAVAVIETGEPADDIERVLDGVRRHADRGAEGFARLTAPLARRARTLLGRRESRPFAGLDPRADVAAVVLAWSTGEVVGQVPVQRTVDAGSGAFLSARARETAEAVARGRPAASVALPTHRGGWIEPRTLVKRLEAGPPASTLDLVAAILRLAPEGRAPALKVAARLRGEPAEAVRYALGGDELIGPTAAWWVAAARVRSPGKDDAAVERRHPGLGPEAGRAAVMTLRIARSAGTFKAPTLDVLPPPSDRAGVDLPTALLLRDPIAHGWGATSGPVMIRWLATIQPGYREPWAAVGSVVIGRNVDWWYAAWGNRAHLEPFLDAWADLGPHALALIGISLGAKEAGERGLATDVARLAIADGRLNGRMLAIGLAAAAAVELDRPRRWALSLADVAADSDVHARVVADACGRVLPSIRERPAGTLVPLLRLLDEVLAASGVPPAAEAGATLERLGASGGQAGRLARSIAARAGESDVSSRAAAVGRD